MTVNSDIKTPPMTTVKLTMLVKMTMLMKKTMPSTVPTPVNTRPRPKEKANGEKDEEELLLHPPRYYSASRLMPYPV